MTIWTQDLCLKPDEQADYDAKEGTCSIDMLVNLTQTHLTPDEEQGVSKAHGRFRRVSLLTTHLGTWALRKSNTKDLQKWEKNDFNLIYLLHLIRKVQGTLPESMRSVPADTPRRILEQFLWGSPKFRRMLTKVDEVCIKNGGKLLLWFNRPLSVILADRLLQFFGVTTRALWAHVDARTRYKHVQEFNIDPEVQVLLISYSIETAGLDMYEMCSNVMMVEPAYSAAKEHQAYHRVRRFGQTENQHVERLFTFDTFNETLEWAQTRKQGPVLAVWGAVRKAQEDLGAKELSGTQLASRALGLSYERLRDRSYRALMDSQYS